MFECTDLLVNQTYIFTDTILYDRYIKKIKIETDFSINNRIEKAVFADLTITIKFISQLKNHQNYNNSNILFHIFF